MPESTGCRAKGKDMSSRTKPVTARKGPMTASPLSIDRRLADGADFIKSRKEEILRGVPAKMTKNIAIGVFCVLKRMESAMARRLVQVRSRIDELVATNLPEMKPGEHEQRLVGGPFSIIRRNGNFNKKEINSAKLTDLLKSKKIPTNAAKLTPMPSPPFFSEVKLQHLVAENKITQAEYDQVMELAKPETSIHVDAPKLIDVIVTRYLLGGIGTNN